MQHSTGYIVGFATVVCLVCAVFVAGAAVGLKDLQDANKLLDRQQKVLTVAGLIEEGKSMSREEITSLYESSVQAKVIDLATGALNESVDAATFDQVSASKDPERSTKAPENPSKIMRLPNQALVFDVVQDGERKALILPIEGYGLWKALWPGRMAFNERGVPSISVKKGVAGPVSEDPYNVDGLSGATITSRGVTNLLRFWLGENGFGPYLEKYRAQAGA
jgi:Na+-transporting NADH:ubiquinone oxidoreductase subunit C